MNMRRAFRRLYDLDPVAFLEVIEVVKKKGVAGLPAAHNGKGRPKDINHTALAMLLADWENAKASKIRKPEFLAARARKGLKWGNEKGQVWRNANTIAERIKDAQRLAKTDADFAETVQFYRWALGKVGADF